MNATTVKKKSRMWHPTQSVAFACDARAQHSLLQFARCLLNASPCANSFSTLLWMQLTLSYMKIVSLPSCLTDFVRVAYSSQLACSSKTLHISTATCDILHLFLSSWLCCKPMRWSCGTAQLWIKLWAERPIAIYGWPSASATRRYGMSHSTENFCHFKARGWALPTCYKGAVTCVDQHNLTYSNLPTLNSMVSHLLTTVYAAELPCSSD